MRGLLSVIAICVLLIATPSYTSAVDQGATIPAGTIIPVRMIDSISSDVNQPGQVFRGRLAESVRVGNRVVLPRGSTAYVRLVDVDSAGKIKGRSELELTLDSVVTPRGAYKLGTNVVVLRGSSQTKKTAKSAGIGAAVGGGLGALFGGGKGAAIGAGLGAGTGVATRAFKEPRPVGIGPESLVNFRLARTTRLAE